MGLVYSGIQARRQYHGQLGSYFQGTTVSGNIWRRISDFSGTRSSLQLRHVARHDDGLTITKPSYSVGANTSGTRRAARTSTVIRERPTKAETLALPVAEEAQHRLVSALFSSVLRLAGYSKSGW